MNVKYNTQKLSLNTRFTHSFLQTVPTVHSQCGFIELTRRRQRRHGEGTDVPPLPVKRRRLHPWTQAPVMLCNITRVRYITLQVLPQEQQAPRRAQRELSRQPACRTRECPCNPRARAPYQRKEGVLYGCTLPCERQIVPDQVVHDDVVFRCSKS